MDDLQTQIDSIKPDCCDALPTAWWLRGLPKADLHLHMEGSFSRTDLLELARASGTRLPAPPDRLFVITTLAAFLDFLDWECSLFTQREQVARAAYSLAARETDSGIRYADVTFNPKHWVHWHSRLDELVDAMSAGFREAREDGMADIGLCISILRSQTGSQALELVDWVLEHRPPRIVGLSIDGDESNIGRSSHRFAAAFERAEKAGLPRAVHAGETSGPEGVRDALDYLHADRIDHGIRSIEDPDLVRLLAERRVPLTLSPMGNILTGYYPSYQAHPAEKLRSSGVRISLGSDAPGALDLRLETEYLLTGRTFGWDKAINKEVARVSIEAAFCDDDLKAALLKDLEDYV